MSVRCSCVLRLAHPLHLTSSCESYFFSFKCRNVTRIFCSPSPIVSSLCRRSALFLRESRPLNLSHRRVLENVSSKIAAFSKMVCCAQFKRLLCLLLVLAKERMKKKHVRVRVQWSMWDIFLIPFFFFFARIIAFCCLGEGWVDGAKERKISSSLCFGSQISSLCSPCKHNSLLNSINLYYLYVCVFLRFRPPHDIASCRQTKPIEAIGLGGAGESAHRQHSFMNHLVRWISCEMQYCMIRFGGHLFSIGICIVYEGAMSGVSWSICSDSCSLHFGERFDSKKHSSLFSILLLNIWIPKKMPIFYSSLKASQMIRIWYLNIRRSFCPIRKQRADIMALLECRDH